MRLPLISRFAPLLLLAAPSPRATAQAPVARPPAGALRGTRDSTGVLHFRGIPYAAPPVGSRRWRAPAPPARWRGVRPAAALGRNCMQWQPYDDIDPYAAGVSEDCLYLNVATAGLAGAPRPVMVWIHGGGFFAGFGGEARHDPAPLAQKGAVVVTLNYRLGAFGFLAHPAFADANVGLQDQIAALRWVRANIGAFGGDPRRVTVFGESAGAMSVGALMASPMARGLFHRAVLQSGTGAGVVARRDSAEALGTRLAAALGVTGAGPDAAARLRALPADTVLAAARAAGGGPRFWPNRDGRVVPRPVDSAAALGRLAPVPVLVGSNADESPEVFGAPARAFARLVSARGRPAYLYQFTRAGEDSAARARGAYHSAEITFVFGRARPLRPEAGRAAYDSSLAETMSDYWVAFATTGDPNGPLPVRRAGAAVRPRWPRYDVRTDSSLGLGAEVAARVAVRRALFDSLDAVARTRGQVRPSLGP